MKPATLGCTIRGIRANPAKLGQKKGGALSRRAGSLPTYHLNTYDRRMILAR